MVLKLSSLWDGGLGEERPESLFMKELKRRGLNPTTLLEEGDAGASKGESRDGGERNGGSTKRNERASAELYRRLSNQRERSMSLNSEGLEVYSNPLTISFHNEFDMLFFNSLLFLLYSGHDNAINNAIRAINLVRKFL